MNYVAPRIVAEWAAMNVQIGEKCKRCMGRHVAGAAPWLLGIMGAFVFVSRRRLPSSVRVDHIELHHQEYQRH